MSPISPIIFVSYLKRERLICRISDTMIERAKTKIKLLGARFGQTRKGAALRHYFDVGEISSTYNTAEDRSDITRM